jgi:hypothetical protein
VELLTPPEFVSAPATSPPAARDTPAGKAASAAPNPPVGRDRSATPEAPSDRKSQVSQVAPIVAAQQT